MTTLISWQSTGGEAGRCDAKCYDAREPDCDCICGRRNHGAGREQALDNTRDLAQEWLARARAAGQHITGAVLAAEAACEPLFPSPARRRGPDRPARPGPA